MSISRRKRRFLSGASFNAEVAELADAHGSGPCTRKGVGVRVPSSAPEYKSMAYPVSMGIHGPLVLVLPENTARKASQESAFMAVLDIC
jgi:hypothetical protein